jgi:hypothetical protein
LDVKEIKTGSALNGLMSENNEIQLAINNETYIFQVKLLFISDNQLQEFLENVK